MATMVELKTAFESELLEQIRMISEEKQQEVLDFVTFIRTKFGKQAEPPANTYNASIIEETWGSIPLDKETSRYVAEDKELEYQA